MNLFSPLSQRSLTLRNRIAVAPMCQYSADEGVPNQWHFVHLGSRAVGGAALVISEATAVEARGRISPADTGLWNEVQAQAWAPITHFIREAGAVAGVQLAHAGRKASVAAPWNGGKPVAPADGGWRPVVAPSALAFDAGSIEPQAMSLADIDALVEAFVAAARRALDAGFELAEIHGAHGYLLHEFLSPLSNRRDDDYGGSFDNRIRLLRRVIAAVRGVWPDRLPLWLRISATDWAADGGWDLEQSCALVEAIRGDGVDLIDVSSGGMLPKAEIPVGPGFQTPFAAEIRRRCGVATGAVGLITAPAQADHIVRTGQADVVLLARELLRDPYWPRRAAAELRQKIEAPLQYQRAW
ncbi:NADH:flavin oxidoreductase/NADH oxidase [Solimonas variicoloris]|uniref:NADH:flavin oxidoreductase/NADH oxidase n=1 Tax=Solimonas variicoloris TaxID=254408 RepID=UPI0003790DB2|nr:NADH:flavin oxidoreductase/NADH oxidase [Solimonas variicoloris]